MEKAPILFVHGVCHGGWCWKEHFVPYFEGLGYECHAMDLRGHEKMSNKASINRHSLSDYVQDVVEAVQTLGRPPILVGHSMGGMIVQKYLEKFSCKKAILLAPVPPSGVFRTSLSFISRHPDTLAQLLGLNLLGVFEKYPREAFFGYELEEETVKKYEERLCAESFKAYLQLLLPRVKVNYHTQIPMLVLGAGKDNIFNPAEAHLTAKKYQADVHIFEESSHNMMVDVMHREVSEYMTQWLEKN